MKDIAIVYGSNSGNTENAANIIKNKLGDKAELINVSGIKAEDIAGYKNIIFGASTWGVGDLQDDWEDSLSTIENMDLSGKNIALFGLGDAISFSSSFVDGIGTIYNAIKDKGCNIFGKCDASDYSYDDSTAIEGDKFVGLPLDEDNESDLTEQRIEDWLDELIPAFK